MDDKKKNIIKRFNYQGVEMKKKSNQLTEYQNLGFKGSEDISFVSSRTKNENDDLLTPQAEKHNQEFGKDQNQQQMSAQSQKQEKIERNDKVNAMQSLSKNVSSKSKLNLSQQRFFQVTKYEANPLSMQESQSYDNLQFITSERDTEKKETKIQEHTRKRRKNKAFQTLDHYVPTESEKVLKWKQHLEQSVNNGQDQQTKGKVTKAQQQIEKKGQDFNDDFLELIEKRKIANEKVPSIQKSASGNVKQLEISTFFLSEQQKQVKKVQKKVLQPIHQKSLHPRRKIDNSMINNPNVFGSQSIQPNFVFETTIQRHRSGTSRLYPIYNLCTTDGLKIFMRAQKDFNCGMGCHYSIYASRQFTQVPNYRRDDIVASVSSNFTGSIFNIYEYLQEQDGNFGSKKQIVATIHYQSENSIHFLPRRLTVYIKKKPYKYSDLEMPKGKQNTQIDLKELYSYDIASNKEKIYVVKNKIPKYNYQSKRYCLNFYNKARVSSVKNIILEGEDGREVLLFVKSDNNDFVLDFGYPFQPKVALGFTLSSFNFKWVCQ